MADPMNCLTNFLFFDIPLWYDYANLNSSIIYCLFLENMYLSFGASDSSLSSIFCGHNFAADFFETLAFLLAILLPIKSPVASAVFWITLFETVFIASVIDFLHY